MQSLSRALSKNVVIAKLDLHRIYQDDHTKNHFLFTVHVQIIMSRTMVHHHWLKH